MSHLITTDSGQHLNRQLFEAAANGHTEAVTVSLAKGADINSKK
jgi:hypothetical protein